MIKRLQAKWRIIVIIIAILLALAIPLMFLLEDFVRDAIVLPASYVWWLLSNITAALPQRFFLSVFILFTLTIAFRSIRIRKVTSWTEKPAIHSEGGQVAVWEQRIKQLSKGTYSRERFAQHLSHVVLRVLAHDQRMTSREVIQECTSRTLSLPETVRQIVMLAQQHDDTARESIGFWVRIWRWIHRQFRRSSDEPDAAYNQMITDVLTFLETKLSIIGLHDSELTAERTETPTHGNNTVSRS